MIVRELNRQLQELQIQLQRNRAKIAEDAQQLEVTLDKNIFLDTVCAGLQGAHQDGGRGDEVEPGAAQGQEGGGGG